MVIHVGPHFTRDLLLKRPAPLQVILDGRNSNTAMVTSGYVGTVVTEFNRYWASTPRLSRTSRRPRGQGLVQPHPPEPLVYRSRYRRPPDPGGDPAGHLPVRGARTGSGDLRSVAGDSVAPRRDSHRKNRPRHNHRRLRGEPHHLAGGGVVPGASARESRAHFTWVSFYSCCPVSESV